MSSARNEGGGRRKGSSEEGTGGALCPLPSQNKVRAKQCLLCLFMGKDIRWGLTLTRGFLYPQPTSHPRPVLPAPFPAGPSPCSPITPWPPSPGRAPFIFSCRGSPLSPLPAGPRAHFLLRRVPRYLLPRRAAQAHLLPRPVSKPTFSPWAPDPPSLPNRGPDPPSPRTDPQAAFSLGGVPGLPVPQRGPRPTFSRQVPGPPSAAGAAARPQAEAAPPGALT